MGAVPQKKRRRVTRGPRSLSHNRRRYARFGKDVRPLLAAVACTRTGSARRYATVDVLAALLRAYGGWKGLKKHLDAPAERAAAAAEREKLAFHRAVIQLEEFVASSRRIPHVGFFAWIEASRAAELRSPAECPDTRAFLTGTSQRPSFARVRRELEHYATAQQRCKERRAVLDAALKLYGLPSLAEEKAYRQFCDSGTEEQASRVALQLACARGVVVVV